MAVQHYLLFGLLVVFVNAASHGSSTQSVYLEEGDDVVLNCTFPGEKPLKKVKWKLYRNGTETIVLYQTGRRNNYKQQGNFHGNLTRGNGAMLLSSVQQSDIGFYVGRILSRRRVHSCKVNLNFYIKLFQTRKILSVNEGENAILECKWPGEPQALTKAECTIKSIGDNTTENNNESETCGTFFGDLNKGDGSVVLYDVKPSDARHYITKLYNKSHIHICEVTLEIVPSNLSKTMVVDESKNVVLTCKWPKHRRLRNVEWTFTSNGRDSTPLQVLYEDSKPKRRDLHHDKPSVRHQKYEFRGNLKSGDGSMLLARVQQSDVGQYTGRLFTSNENCTCKINLLINIKLFQTRKIPSVNEGENAILECKWPGEPQALTKAEWTIKSIGDNTTENNNESERCGTFVGDLNKGDGSVVLYDVKPSDARHYISKLYNKSHIHICEVTLEIGPSILPKTMVVDESKNVVLNCKWPKHRRLRNVEWPFTSNGRDSTPLQVLYEDSKPKRRDLHHDKPSVRHQKYEFRGNLKSGDGSMLLARVQQSDVGQYTGRLFTSNENCTCKINLYIRTLKRKHEIYYIKKGDHTFFECKWPNGSEPITSVRWKFQSSETERTVLTCPDPRDASRGHHARCVGNLPNGVASMYLDSVNDSDVGFYTGMLFRSGRVHVCEFLLHIQEGEVHSTETFGFGGVDVNITTS
uniref:titin-like isoform X3 n=1 Tax=Myxine glutinosa TaxID=7769 RepID=UPI00358F1587